jgi:hypothetical protein
MPPTIPRLLAPAAIVGLLAARLSAAILWTDNGNQIMTFDSANPGVMHLVGPTGWGLAMDGLDFAGDGSLYGVADRDLFLIDQQTGHATLIGDEIIGYDPGKIFFDLSWDPLLGKMFGLACKGGEAPELYEFDLAARTATLVARLFYSDFLPPGGLATTSAGVRYIDSGYGVHVRRLGEPEDGWIELYNFPPHTYFKHCFFGGMTIDWSRDNTCYHATVNLDVAPNGQVQLWTINLATGNGTFLGVVADGNSPILDVAIQPVPEPAAIPVGLLFAAAFVCPRRWMR